MTKIEAHVDYNSGLWLDHKLGERSYTLKWGENELVIHVAGLSVATIFSLSDDAKIELFEALVKDDPTHPPQWQDVPPTLQRIVDAMAIQLVDAASAADRSIRGLAKGTRLSPLKFRQFRTSSNQEFPVFYWIFSEEEKLLLSPIIEKIGSKAAESYKRHLAIPMPRHFERRQAHLTETEINKIQELLISDAESEAFRNLYALALESFIGRSYDSAVLILATSIEAALKSYLVRSGDGIADYLLSNIQSPPIDKLYACARKQANMDLPKGFGAWLVGLRDARNSVAHKPRLQTFPPLLISRWFAMGEAILSYMAGNAPDPLVGKLVEPIGDKAPEKFPENARGVILRRELLYDEHSYHVVIDTGETWRFGESKFRVCDDQNINCD